MLGLNIESNLRPKTAWLQTYLGLSPDAVASVLKSFPAVLALTVENLEGKVRPLLAGRRGPWIRIRTPR